MNKFSIAIRSKGKVTLFATYYALKRAPVWSPGHILQAYHELYRERRRLVRHARPGIGFIKKALL